jgi:hypothetical protein
MASAGATMRNVDVTSTRIIAWERSQKQGSENPAATRAALLLGCPAVSRRRYVARGVPGGYHIWDNKARRRWGDLYEVCPDELLDELNGTHDPEKITALLRGYRAHKR